MPGPRRRNVGSVGVRRLILACGVLGLFVLGLEALRFDVGNRSPEVEMTTVKGERVKLSDLRGGPVLIVFWASDCGPCIAEIPELISLDRDFGGRRVHLIAVAMAYDLPSRVLALTAAAGVSYRVVLDVRGTIASVFGRVEVVPTAFLIGPDGLIVQRKTGPLDFGELRVRLLRMLGDS